MAIQSDKIKEILSSRIGRRLLTCLCLVQPITSSELKLFPRLCFEIYKPYHSLDTRNRQFPINVSNEKRNGLPEFPYLFTNEDLYKRVLKKSIESGLVINVPQASNKSRYNYYFLNSDICFTVNKNGMNIKEDTSFSSEEYHYTICKNEKGKRIIQEKIKDKIALPRAQKISERGYFFEPFRFNSLPRLLNMFHWTINDPKFLKEVHEVYYESNQTGLVQKTVFPSWRKNKKYKIYSALKDGILISNPDNKRRVYIAPLYSIFGDNEFRFTRSYNPLKCLSNFDIDDLKLKQKTPIQYLQILTSEKYSINQEKRPFVFTSLMFNINNIDYEMMAKFFSETKSDIRECYKKILIKQNTFFIEDALLDNPFSEIWKVMKKDEIIREYGYKLRRLFPENIVPTEELV